MVSLGPPVHLHAATEVNGADADQYYIGCSETPGKARVTSDFTICQVVS